jgi:protoporphyrinogen oxidase
VTRTAVIVGAGPAGLTAAYELLQRSDMRVVVIESDIQVGGISKTINYRGNRMDLGGHRFFSKSDWVMRWWQSILPVAAPDAAEPAYLAYHGQVRNWSASHVAATGADADRVMLVRSRLSRIFYRRRFLDYPLKLSAATLRNLGAAYTASVGASYLYSKFAPRKPELTLEDFLINRFGKRLYCTFFRDYTQKVWGVPCSEISAEWGAQRIKGLSIRKALTHAITRPFRSTNTEQKTTETSLIERFLYPKLGPGQMWEEVARRVIAAGGEICLQTSAVALVHDDARIRAVRMCDVRSGATRTIDCDFLLSTMPLKTLVEQLQPTDPLVASAATDLPYRDFMTVGLLVSRMRGGGKMPPDNWIYIQEPDVKIGRLQIFNNWSPALVADPDTVWLGLEYFCARGDELWSQADGTFIDFAAAELAKIGLIDRAAVLDGTVVRVPGAYPAYFGSYRHIGRIRGFLDRFQNLLPIGRNGMHRYNNQDHSMLAARAAVDYMLQASGDKSALWAVNAEDEYHEQAA